jgi:hypothetical protein
MTSLRRSAPHHNLGLSWNTLASRAVAENFKFAIEYSECLEKIEHHL